MECAATFSLIIQFPILLGCKGSLFMLITQLIIHNLLSVTGKGMGFGFKKKSKAEQKKLKEALS